MRPKPGSLSGDACAFSGSADVLTGASPGDNVNPSAPGPSVEGANVVPDREVGQHPVTLSGKQYPPSIVVDFDGANRSPSQQMASEDTASGPCK